jgi:hypothetical protein
MVMPAGYRSTPSGFWVRDDGSGPFFVDIETGEATAVGSGDGSGSVTSVGLTENDPSC